MIVADSSSLVSIVLGEDDAERHLAALERDDVGISAVSIVESSIVVESRQGPDAPRDLTELIEGIGAKIIAVDAEHAQVAVAAWQTFGKGRHPARLNLGDCFSYAAARLTGSRLLFKGDDFSRTDIVPVL